MYIVKSGSKQIYEDIKNFDRYLLNLDQELYKKLAKIGQVRYNRKTKFIFTRLYPNFFSKWINFISKVLRG